MRWDCGPTWEEIKAAREQWHPWFAWYPVRVGPRDCRWLERVERKGTCWEFIFRGSPWSYEYRSAQGKEVNDGK
jgi:hypothetical protein